MIEGLLWGFTKLPDGSIQTIENQSDLASLEPGNFTWLHFQSDLPGTESALLGLDLHEDVVNALCASETRPRMMQFANGNVLLLRAINKNANAEPEDMVSLRLWISEQWVISTRKRDRSLRSTQLIKQKFEQNRAPANAAELASLLIQNITEIIGEVVDDIDEEVSRYEDELTEGFGDRLRLSEVRKRSADLRRFLSPQRDALEEFYRNGVLLDSTQRSTIRELSDRTARYVEELDLCREHALVLQEELRQNLAEKQATRLYVLSLVTAVFLPLSFLTGVFGMNVAGLPGVENPLGFVYVAGIMAIIALVVMVVMKMQKWF